MWPRLARRSCANRLIAIDWFPEKPYRFDVLVKTKKPKFLQARMRP